MKAWKKVFIIFFILASVVFLLRDYLAVLISADVLAFLLSYSFFIAGALVLFLAVYFICRWYFQVKPKEVGSFTIEQLAIKALEQYCYDDSAIVEYKNRESYIIDFAHYYQDKNGNPRVAFLLCEGRKPKNGWVNIKVHKIDGDRAHGLVDQFDSFVSKDDVHIASEWHSFLKDLSEYQKILPSSVVLPKKSATIDEVIKQLEAAGLYKELNKTEKPKESEPVEKK